MRWGRFACRKCQKVAYSSQSEDPCACTWRAQSKIENRLGEYWKRPKGMRTSTHARLVDPVVFLEEQCDALLSFFVDQLMSMR